MPVARATVSGKVPSKCISPLVMLSLLTLNPLMRLRPSWSQLRISALRSLSWLTGTDEALFAGIAERAQCFRVRDARVLPAAEAGR